jgi:hypothetical protein
MVKLMDCDALGGTYVTVVGIVIVDKTVVGTITVVGTVIGGETTVVTTVVGMPLIPVVTVTVCVEVEPPTVITDVPPGTVTVVRYFVDVPLPVTVAVPSLYTVAVFCEMVMHDGNAISNNAATMTIIKRD